MPGGARPLVAPGGLLAGGLRFGGLARERVRGPNCFLLGRAPSARARRLKGAHFCEGVKRAQSAPQQSSSEHGKVAPASVLRTRPPFETRARRGAGRSLSSESGHVAAGPVCHLLVA